MHINWHTQFRSWHILWLVKKKKDMSIGTLAIKVIRITRQLKYYKVQLKYPENITHNSRRTSYTYLHTPVHRCSYIFFCNREGSTIETIIREVVEAKYKADKTILLGLLHMYFRECFVHGCEWTICPNRSRKVMLWLVKYWVNSKASQLDIGMNWGKVCIMQRSLSNWI